MLDETLEYLSAGAGAFTVVLVNGSGGPIEGWHKVFAPLAGFARVFAYNRAGIGGSTEPSYPQRGTHLVRSLRGALQAAGVEPPYVLVGHSFGGLIVNLFARLHPNEVAAVVMVEATAPRDVAVLKTHATGLQRLLQGALRRLAPANPNAETEQAAATVVELESAPPFPPIPLTVVSGGKPAMRWATAQQALAARAKHQRELAGLSPLGEQIIAAGSGHFPQFTEPQCVVDAIRATARRAGLQA
ncbi:alpha/beta fold hydrolase [Pseudomonas subflava]|uniref:alpha/beta fold hydrolase n=1 Tax=Pseudomonas subflava TaxID=2952933 RepID=UPI002079DF6D